MNDSSVSVPDPAHISFPWNESNRSAIRSPNRSCVQEIPLVNKATSDETVATSVERKHRTTSPALRIENSSNKTAEKDVCQCDSEKKPPHNPDCAGDYQDIQRKQIIPHSTECRRYHAEPGCKPAFLHEDYINEGKSHILGALDVNRSFDDQTDTIAESPVTARVPSPSSASSVTSGRRLEWDSGADVGYHFVEDHNLQLGASLSTIERIALAHGRSTGLFERLDPEGVCGPPRPVLGLQLLGSELDSPIAKSTPIFKNENKTNAVKISMAPAVETPETVLPGEYLYIHSPEEFGNEMAPFPRKESEGQNEDSSDEDKIPASDNFNKKHSNSLVNLNASCEEVHGSVPRSKSYLNLLDQENESIQPERAVHLSRVLTGTCSVSSSSVATIVQKPIFPKTSDKFIQTLPLKLSIGVQVGESMEHSRLARKISGESSDAFSAEPVVNDETKNQKGKISSKSKMFQNHRCNGAHKKGSTKYNHCPNYQFQALDSAVNNNCSEKSSEKVQIKEKENSQGEEFHNSEKGTLGSAGSSSQMIESGASETWCSGVELPRGTHLGSPGVADSTNSFEYLPGHVFDKASKCPRNTSKQSVLSGTSANQMPLKSNVSTEKNGRSDSRSSSLSKDIEEGVELLQKLMSEKSYNGKTKKKLIRLIVNKLVNTDYPEDHKKKPLPTVPLSGSVPWVPAAQAPHLETLHASQYFDPGERKSVQSFNTLSNSERTKDRTVDSVEAVSETQSSPSSCTPSGSVSVPGDNEQSPEETAEVSSNIYESSRRDWKTPTSRTEEEYETNRAKFVKNSSPTPTPSLLNLCKSEHEKQLQWIRFEIDHLSQLKQLLEKQEGTKSRSNLVDHEHKFHKIKPANKPKTKGNGWSNSTVKDESSQDNASLKSCSSSSLIYQEPSLPHSHHFARASRIQSSHRQSHERGMRKTEKKKDLSTQTLSLDSYILQNGSTDSGLIGVNSSGQLNVYVQTTPRGLEKHKRADQQLPIVERISDGARRSYESAVQCCCECRKTLEGLMTKHDERVQKFCRCVSANSESNSLDTDISSSFDDSGSARISHTLESNNTVGKQLPQKRDIGTETVVNKTVQTTQSLNDIPIIKPIWSRETSGESTLKAKDNFCPCCGLQEKSFAASDRSFALGKPKKRSDPKNKHLLVDGQGKQTICNTSVQTDNKEPLAYLLTFEPTSKENTKMQSNDALPEIKLLVPVNQNRLEKEMKRKTCHLSVSKENQCPLSTAQPGDRESLSVDRKQQEGEERKMHKLTLQEYLQANRPDYIQHADKRSQCLADLALLRDLRKQKRLELMAMTDPLQDEKPQKAELSNERVVFSCAGVPSKAKPASRVMREQSRRKYHKTREVQNKFVEKKKKEDFKTNRLMAELFTKKLQKKVLQGMVNHSNSASIISSVP